MYQDAFRMDSESLGLAALEDFDIGIAGCPP
jgi:hypothetical protein